MRTSSAQAARASSPIGCTFDPIPDPVTADYAAGHLELLDLVVFGKLFRGRQGESSPGHLCTKERIAEALGGRQHPRTIQRSFARLKEHGWIDHVKVDHPDPANRANRTGYRVVFPKLAAGNAYAPAIRTYPRSPRPAAVVSPPRETQPCPGGGRQAGVSPTFEGMETGIETTTTEPESSSSISIPIHQDPETRRSVAEPVRPVATHEPPAAPCTHAETEDHPAPDELPADLVGTAAEILPDASSEWLRGLVAACGRYGADLAFLVLLWVQARLGHQDPAKRPTNPRSYAMTSVIGSRNKPGWRHRLDEGLITLDDIRADIRASPRVAGPPPFDPAALLARLNTEGWTIAPDPNAPGTCRTARIRESATLWGKIRSEVREEAERHKVELRAYVLEQAAGKGVAP